MAGDEEAKQEWEALIEPHKDDLVLMSGPVAMAQYFANTMAAAKGAEMEPRVPVAAVEWAEEIFSMYFETVGKIAKASGIRRKLIDRGLYDPSLEGAPEWNEGLTLEELDIIDRDDPASMYHLDEYEEMVALEDHYGPFALEQSFRRKFAGVVEESGRPLSGQYNRLFPVKLVLRTAANLFRARNEYTILGDDGEDGESEYDPVYLDELREECIKVAKYAKETFHWIDGRSGKDLGERLAVGLTDGGKKQNERFVAQFVGSVRNKGSGLPFELGLLDVEEDGEVKFTETGARFMLQKNPLMDASDVETWMEGEAFSIGEKSYLIRLIKTNAPAEFELMTKILSWIESGTNRPKSLEASVSKEYDLKDTEASIMRSGAVARMGELGLILREKSGREVTYSLTDLGKSMGLD